MRGLPASLPPPKMPPRDGGCAGVPLAGTPGAGGRDRRGGTAAEQSAVGGTRGGAGGVAPPVAGTAEGSITNTSSRCRPVTESLGRSRRHAVSSSSPGCACRYSMPRRLIAILPRAQSRRMRSFIAVSPSHGMQSCPAGRGSCSSRSSLPTEALSAGGFEHESLEVLRHEQIVGQRLLDGFGNLRALLLEALDAELALRRVGEVPAMQHGEAVEPLLENVAQASS